MTANTFTMERDVSSPATLVEFFDRAVVSRPSHPAVEDGPGNAVTYEQLAALAGRMAGRLAELGVQPGDRVGILVEKSIEAVAAIQGILRVGAAYVPVDSDSPSWRAAYILADCAVRVVVIESRLEEGLREQLALLGAPAPTFMLLDHVGTGRGLDAALGTSRGADGMRAPGPDDVAYILYTSGSTGKPKGVTLTHRNAVSFVTWCVESLGLHASDRFSSHAPLHFDLSILDLYAPVHVGATVVLIGNAAGKEPIGLAEFIAERRLTVWYSTPSILSMLAQYGKMQRHSYEALRVVLFAGEVFPVKHLRALKELLPSPAYYNLYGPTETNVCTWFRLPSEVEPDRTEPYPIGKICKHLLGRVVDGDGNDVVGEGELCIAGPAVMREYWNLPELTARAFLVDGEGVRWYRTGDIVTPDQRGDLRFVGRRDRMVKRRGYRIELGEVEAGLYRHTDVEEAAAVAVAGPDGTTIIAFLTCRSGTTPSMIEMKRFCAQTMPASMVPDRFRFMEALPKTSTDKIDYQELAALL
jgi:amino acid adenylation domain-containing protein